jgi:chaperone BCS1
MMDFIRQQLENQFLSGGAVLMLLGVALALLRKVPRHIGSFLHRRLVTTVDVNDQDEAFYWMQEWLAQHPYSKRSRLLTVTTENSSYAPADANKPMLKNSGYPKAELTGEEESGRRQPKIYFTPAPGLHLLRFEGHWVLLYRVREKQEGSNSGRYWREQFILKTLVRDRKFLRRLILEARAAANPPDEERISIFANNYGSWNLIGTRLPRGFDSVILENDTMNEVVARVEEFFSSSEWYQERGIPYQMGFLFHGPPGNGKTSTAIALASQFNRDIHLAKIDALSDHIFRQVMSHLPQHSILLIEDIDCFFQERRQVPGNDPLMTFSGFLNALDGVIGTEGRLLILTSNHPERLDGALLRPGRIDYKVEFGNASGDQARRLFLRFFPDELELAKDFAAGVGGGDHYSMADLQKVLLDNRNDPSGAIVSVTKEEAA